MGWSVIGHSVRPCTSYTKRDTGVIKSTLLPRHRALYTAYTAQGNGMTVFCAYGFPLLPQSTLNRFLVYRYGGRAERDTRMDCSFNGHSVLTFCELLWRLLCSTSSVLPCSALAQSPAPPSSKWLSVSFPRYSTSFWRHDLQLFFLIPCQEA